MKKLLTFLMFFLLASTHLWAAEEPYYKLTAKQSSSNTNYATYYDVTINDMTWSVPGNQNFSGYWRIGGGSLNNTDRVISSKSQMGSAIRMVRINHNGVSNSNLTVNSISISAYSDEKFSKMVGKEFKAENPSVSSGGTLELTPGIDWPIGAYYKIVFNLSNNQSRNYGLDITSIDFFASTSSADPCTVTLGDDNTELTEASAGAGVTLPSRSNVGDWSFVGWSTSNYAEESTTVPTIIEAGLYKPTANVTLYPVYSKTEGAGEPTTASVNISEYATANSWQGLGAVAYKSITLDDNITVTTTGTGNNGKYYNDWRLYQNGSGNAIVTAKNGYTIQSVTFTFSVASYGVLKYNDSPVTTGSEVNVGGVESATFTVGNSGNATNGQVKITAIEVKYTSSGTTYYISTPVAPVVVTPPTFTPAGGEYTEAQTVTISADGASYIYWTTGDDDIANMQGNEIVGANGTAQITTTCTLKAVAMDEELNVSSITEATYTINIPVTKYSVKIANDITNGSVSPDKTSAAEGDVVTLTVTPAEHYHLATLTWNGNNATKVSETVYTFTMPAEDVTVNATFEQDAQYTVTWSVNGIAKDFSIGYAGTELEKPSVTDPDGYKFIGWSSEAIAEPIDNEPTTTTPTVMPAENTTYYAVFAKETQGEDVTVTLDATSLKTATYNEGTKKDDKNNTWSYYASINNLSGTLYFGLNSNVKNYNIGSPEFSGNITAISLKAYNGSSSDTRKLLICSSNQTAQPENGDIAEIMVSASEKFTNTYNANLTNAGNFKQFYIYAQAALGVSKVNVTYSTKSYSDYCTTLSEVAPLASLETMEATELPVVIGAELEVVAVSSTTSENAVWVRDNGNSYAKVENDGKKIGNPATATYTQNNWLKLVFDENDQNSTSIAVGKVLTDVKGVYSGSPYNSHEIKVESYTVSGEQKEVSLNLYTVANFNTGINLETGVKEYNGVETFFMTPKAEEVCTVTYAYWNGETFVMPNKETTYVVNGENVTGLNPNGYEGSIAVDWSKNGDNFSAPGEQVSTLYEFTAIVTRTAPAQAAPVHGASKAPATGGYKIYPVGFSFAEGVVTGVEDLNVSRVNGSKAVKMIENGRVVIVKDGKKFNIMGQPVW